MSCNCNAKYDNKVPCCCATKVPVECTTTICPDAQPCDQTVESDCVIYTGNDYDCAGIESGMTVTEVMDIILASLNLIECTTTTTDPSGCYLVTNTMTELSGEYTYKQYITGNILTETIEPLKQLYICSDSVVTVTNGVLVEKLNDLTCLDIGRTCLPPAAYCYALTIIGTSNFYYRNAFGILTETGLISDTTIYICAWENSIEKIPDTGVCSFTAVSSGVFCGSNDECPPVIG